VVGVTGPVVYRVRDSCDKAKGRKSRNKGSMLSEEGRFLGQGRSSQRYFYRLSLFVS